MIGLIWSSQSSNLSSVLIWDCESLGLVAELKGHLYGAQCLSFSPNGRIPSFLFLLVVLRFCDLGFRGGGLPGEYIYL